MAFEFLTKEIKEALAQGTDATTICMKSIERRFSFDILEIVCKELSKKYNIK